MSAELWDLHRAGRLAAEFPRVSELVAGLPPDELDRAGRLLTRIDIDDVLATHPDIPVVDAVITGYATVAAVVPALTAELARHRLLLRPRLGDFGGYLGELNQSDGLTLAVLDPFAVFDEVPLPWRPADVEQAFTTKLGLIESLVAEAKGTIVLNTIPLPRIFPAQLIDHRSRAELGAVWRAANARLLRLTHQYPHVLVIDLDPLVAEGIQVHDARLSVYAKAHLSAELLQAYAREAGHIIRAKSGLSRKVLAVDLDETVWGGVLGEVGPEGVEVADSHRGEAFQAFQRVLRQLGAQGVLLAAVSKNDLEPVRKTLAGHPRITLREEDFVRIVANWRPKHENLAELVADLNLGIDSVVFVDDSPFERGLVNRELPQVKVIAVDAEPAGHIGSLLADGWFDVIDLTGEDRERTVRYREELERKDFLHSFDSLQDYLTELGVRVDLSEATEADVPRISQITLRTNQFNLTTKRLQIADVNALTADPAVTVLTVRSADRFGDNGLTGAVFLRRHKDTVHIENFLLSCRVFSRGIETATLATVLRHARDSGASAVTAEYRATQKNGKVAELYPRNGFTGSGTWFRHDLAEISDLPDHIELTGTWPAGGAQ